MGDNKGTGEMRGEDGARRALHDISASIDPPRTNSSSREETCRVTGCARVQRRAVCMFLASALGDAGTDCTVRAACLPGLSACREDKITQFQFNSAQRASRLAPRYLSSS